LAKHGYTHVSMDAIIGGVETVFPELCINWWPCGSNDIDILRIASEKVTLFIKSMLESGECYEFAAGMIVDVVQVLPEHYMKHLDNMNSKIVYLLTSDVTPEERFVMHRKYDAEKDYTFEFSDDEMHSHCNFIIERSQLLKEQCMQYGLPYYDTSYNRFETFDTIMRELF